MKGNRITRRGFFSKLTTWARHSLIAVVPLAWIGRGKPTHFQEVAPERSNSSGLLAKKGCSCDCKKTSLQSAASNSAANALDPKHVVACDCGSGAKDKAWIASARRDFQTNN